MILLVLLQRSEGGGLGIGGGGNAATGRSATTPVQKMTWIVAIGFLVTSITLTIIATQNAAGDSVIERLGVDQNEGTLTPPALPSLDGDLTPPSPAGTPVTPPAAD